MHFYFIFLLFFLSIALFFFVLIITDILGLVNVFKPSKQESLIVNMYNNMRNAKILVDSNFWVNGI